MDTIPVTKIVTGRNRLKSRFGYKSKVAQDINSIPSLNILCNMVAPFLDKHVTSDVFMNSFSTYAKYNNEIRKINGCLKGKNHDKFKHTHDFYPVKENSAMINEEEKLIFLKELGRLIDDYKRCCDDEYQEQIYEDIMHLINVIH